LTDFSSEELQNIYHWDSIVFTDKSNLVTIGAAILIRQIPGHADGIGKNVQEVFGYDSSGVRE
jgi:hypothetical protein